MIFYAGSFTISCDGIPLSIFRVSDIKFRFGKISSHFYNEATLQEFNFALLKHFLPFENNFKFHHFM
jgi:hypothetical protein